MKPPPPPPIALVICDVFEKELALVTAGASHIVEQRVFEIALHDRPEVMRGILQGALTELDRRDDIEAIVLVYGLCGCGTAGLRAERHPLVIPRAHDCRAVFLGSKERFASRQEACPGCYYYTPGWNLARRVPGPERVAFLQASLSEKFDPEDVEFLIASEREMWANYDTAAFIDLGTAEAAREAAYTQACAQALGWQYEYLKGDPALLRDLIWGPWDDARYQIVRPGQKLAHAVDDAILRADPTESQP
ncbi:MAG: DUF1638 domain-containing protein [Verrucomicrobia bacterium]|nr:DUF1638 domain-containing protein [Verrucomicrobiota bacterium]